MDLINAQEKRQLHIKTGINTVSLDSDKTATHYIQFGNNFKDTNYGVSLVVAETPAFWQDMRYTIKGKGYDHMNIHLCNVGKQSIQNFRVYWMAVGY